MSDESSGGERLENGSNDEIHRPRAATMQMRREKLGQSAWKKSECLVLHGLRTARRNQAAEKSKMTITLPLRLENPLNGSQGISKAGRLWRAKKRAEQRWLVGLHARKFDGAHIKAAKFPLAITLTRIAPRPFDGDGLQAAFKGTRDGISDALGINDGHSSLIWIYNQRKGKPREYSIEIVIGE